MLILIAFLLVHGLAISSLWYIVVIVVGICQLAWQWNKTEDLAAFVARVDEYMENKK